MQSPEIIAALIAAIVSTFGIIASYLIGVSGLRSQRNLQHAELQASEARLRTELAAKQAEWQANLQSQELQWQESFRADLRRNLVQESTLEVTRLRLQVYAEVWKALRVTSRHDWREHTEQKQVVSDLAERFTGFAYGEPGMLMSDRSRRLLNNVRSGCSQFLRDEIDGNDLIDRIHMLKHSLRADLGILDYEYESDLLAIAESLGKVDDWRKPTPE